MFLRPRNFRLLRIKNSIFLDGHASLSNVSNHLQYSNPLTDKPDWIPFNQAKYGEFNQEEPVLGNQFTEDALLQRYLKRNIPSEVYSEIEPDLKIFGHKVVSSIYSLGRRCELEQPKLIQQNAWGKTVNELITSDAWKAQKVISAEEGLVAIAYERKFGEWSRLYQMAKQYLYSPSGGLYSCPLAMTDGAAKTIEALDLTNHPLYREAYERLTSRDPQHFWTSGQWMTEKGGGSDVAAGTETIAVPQGGGIFRLYGYKWFSSATDSDMSLTLARITDLEGNVLLGTRGLSLFYLKVRNEDGNLNNINLIRLKDKLGTRQLPTAELLLDGVLAHKMSEEGRGVSAISNMLQVTRVYSAVGTCSGMRRLLNLARDYAQKRRAFGKLLIQHPLHVQTLARMDVEARACFLLSFETAKLLGKQDTGTASDEDVLLLRILTPLAKLYVCKQALPVISEGLEAFGGQGVMEDTGIPIAYRDTQINAIWEGTTNILSLDVLRCLVKTNGEALVAFRSHVKSKLENVKRPLLKPAADKINHALDQLIDVVQKQTQVLEQGARVLEYGARDFSFSLARLFTSATILEFAETEFEENIALRYINGLDIIPFVTNVKLNFYSSENTEFDKQLVLENYNKE